MKVKLDLIIEYEDEEGEPLPKWHFPYVQELLCEAASTCTTMDCCLVATICRSSPARIS